MRTGVTAVLPRGPDSLSNPVFAGWFAQNGNGEMTGTTWVEESGFLEGPVMITNTHSVGVVRDAVIQWRVAHGGAGCDRVLLVAAGGRRNLGRLAERHQRLSRQAGARRCTRSTRAHAGAVEEGNVGGGTGMICNGYKGGIGTRVAPPRRQGRRLHGRRARAMQLRHAGQSAHRRHSTWDAKFPRPNRTRSSPRTSPSAAPSSSSSRPTRRCCAHQLKRLAHRVTLGLGRNGSISGNGSGDIFIAFSTANSGAAAAGHVVDLKMLPNDSLDPVFRATVEATEEAIVNAMVAARGHDRRGRSSRHRATARGAARRAQEIRPPGALKRVHDRRAMTAAHWTALLVAAVSLASPLRAPLQAAVKTSTLAPAEAAYADWLDAVERSCDGRLRLHARGGRSRPPSLGGAFARSRAPDSTLRSAGVDAAALTPEEAHALAAIRKGRTDNEPDVPLADAEHPALRCADAARRDGDAARAASRPV